MNEPRWKWLDLVGDGLLAGVLAAVILLCIFIMSLGCSTCPPCQPTIETVEVKVPVYSCPAPPELQSIVLPEFPGAPADLGEEDQKSWYAQVASLVKAREKTLLEYVKYLQDILEEYRTP